MWTDLGRDPLNAYTLDSLSRIGFGCYRVSVNSPDHYQAILHALELGCNLIDTAANYMDGESELLLGRVLAEHPDHDAFVVTKAGYIDTDSLRRSVDLERLKLANNAMTKLSEGSFHSIHPDVLSIQLEQSLTRIKKKSVDALMLHNPEHYFDELSSAKSKEDYYAKIKSAFEFLEYKVSDGKIRYYGISSNTFPFSTERHNTTNLHRVLAIAREVSSTNHFALIEFPFNLIERDALETHHGNTSLLAAAKASGIKTLSNRPLNAKVSNGLLRLATYDDDIQGLDPEIDRGVLEECLEIIRLRLGEIGASDDVMDFAVVGYLHENWMRISSPETVTSVFRQYLFPFLDRLFEGEIPLEARAVFQRLYHYTALYSRRTMTVNALALRERLVGSGAIDGDDVRPLAVIACASVLSSGIDHVLVGMRQTRYVETLKPLFHF